MPNPANYENESDWMAACVPAVVAEGKPRKVAVAQCINIWRNRKKEYLKSVTEAEKKLEK